MATRMQQRRGTAAQWTAANPTLAAGEIGFETDTSKFKMGNGSSAWTALTYFANATELAAIVDGAPGLLNTLNELAQAIGDDPDFINTVAQGLTTHTNDSTMVHGIVDTALLATTGNLATTATAAATALAAHEADTTLVHGIVDTSLLATTANVATALSSATSALTDHAADTTLVHGIVNTADLVTQSDLTDAISGAAVNQESLAGTGIDWNSVNTRFDIDSTIATKTYADNAVSTHNSDTSDVHGIADTSALALTATVNTALDLKAPLASPTFTGTVSGITKTMVGLGSVDNTTDSAKPVSTATQTALDLKADLASPALTGVPTAPTAAAGTSTTQVATTSFVGTAVSNLVASSPAALDTLNELATALGNDASFSTTVTNSLALKAPLASPTFTGTVTAPAITATALITASASGVAFTDGTQTKEGVASRTPIVQKTAAYTLSALTERDSLIEVSSATGVTITIPTNTAVAYPIGTSIDILQTGAGQVTVAGDSGVTVNATPGLKLRTTWSSATLFKRAANTWVVFGDLTA
jgi:hypothetical protein